MCKTDYGQEEAIAIFGRDPRIYETTVSHLLLDAEGHLTGVETVLLGPDRKPLTGTEKLLPCQLLLIAVGFLGPQDYVPEAFGLTRTPCSTVQTAEGAIPPTSRRVHRRGHAPGTVPGGVGHSGGPRSRLGSGQVPDGTRRVDRAPADSDRLKNRRPGRCPHYAALDKDTS